MMCSELAASLRQALQEHAIPDTKAWWENYVKGSAPFMGVKMPVIRKVLHRWHKDPRQGLSKAVQADAQECLTGCRRGSSSATLSLRDSPSAIHTARQDHDP